MTSGRSCSCSKPNAHGSVDHLLLRIAENVGALGIDVNQPLVLQDVDAHQRLLDQGAILGLGRPQRFFGLAPLGDVARHRLHAGQHCPGVDHA